MKFVTVTKIQTAALYQFAKKRRYLFWSTRDIARLNAEAIVEATLNYGDWEDFKTLVKILGMKKIATIFRAQTTNQWRTNYQPKVANYFSLFFKKYA